MPAKTTAENAAARTWRRPSRYRPVMAGVSFTPASSPTSPPASHHCGLVAATSTPSTRKTLTCPKLSVVRTGSNHAPTAVHSTAARCQYGSVAADPTSIRRLSRTTPYSAATVASCHRTASTGKGIQCSGTISMAANGG